jgi:hypothetical protein
MWTQSGLGSVREPTGLRIKGKSLRPLEGVCVGAGFGGCDRVEKCEKIGMSGHRWCKEIKRDGVRK